MSKVQYILLMAIVGFYGSLFVMLVYRATVGMWQTARPVMKPGMKKISRAVSTARNRAWTRAVWRGALISDAR